jgi:hypothetical protein
MQWDGEWKPTLQLTPTQMRSRFFGTTDITVDGRAIRCEIYNYRGQTFARRTDWKPDRPNWFLLCR